MELDPKLARIARDAAVLRNEDCGTTADDAFNRLIESIKKRPESIQKMIGHLMAIQDKFPMPEAGKKAFIQDIEYTNKKHGWNLQIKKDKE